MRSLLLCLLLIAAPLQAQADPGTDADLVVLESFSAPTVHLAGMMLCVLTLFSSGWITVRLNTDSSFSADAATMAAAAAVLVIPTLASAAVVYGIADTSKLRAPSFGWTLLTGLLANAAWYTVLYLAKLPAGLIGAASLVTGAAEVVAVNLLDGPRAEGLALLFPRPFVEPAPTAADLGAHRVGLMLLSLRF